jgi:hypothetical protein
MYCPKCGQQQAGENTRFCSRCGLPIGEVSEWLAGGLALAVREEAAPPALMSPKRRNIRRGAKLMFISGVLLPIFFGISLMVDGPGPLIVPFTIFLAGLSLYLYSRIFGEEIAPAKSQTAQPPRLAAMPGGNALPPASNAWAGSVGRQQARTSELAQPPSVTEHTTRFLNND